MKILKLMILSATLSISAFAQGNDEADRDTMYQLSPVIINPMQAKERETPVTFSNLSRENIHQRYSVQDVPVLLSELPSMTFYSENGNGIGYNYINLRGFDQRRLSIMINGVPQNDPEDHNVYWIDFPDLMASAENIQVQRGAGSAFYGPPAIGGSVNLVTNPFFQKQYVILESMFGFQEFGDGDNVLPLTTRKYTATISSGLINRQYMLYGRLGKILSDGYRANSSVELNSYFLGAVRYDNAMTTRIHFFGGPFTDALAYVGLPKSYNSDAKLRRSNYSYWDTTGYIVRQKPQAVESFSQPHYELLHEWKLSPKLMLYNTLFLYMGEGFFDYDGDWIPYPDGMGNPSLSSLWFQKNVGYDSTFGVSTFPTLIIRGFVANKQWGWLPRIEIQHDMGSLTVGGELRLHRSTHWGKIQSASLLPYPGFDPDFHIYEYNGEKDIMSLYGHELFRLNDQLTIMADLQLIRNRYGIRNEKFLGNSFDRSYFFANPRMGVNYNVNDEWNGYLSVSYTSREPRLRNLYAAEDAFFGAAPEFKADTTGGTLRYNFDRPFAKAEHLLDIELGAGYRTSDIQLTASTYWMEFSDELVKSGKIDIFGQPITGNADLTRHIGLELEGNFKVSPFTVNGNVTFSHNVLVKHRTFIEQTDTSGNSFFGPVDLDGNPIAGFPDFLGNLRVTHTFKGLNSSVLLKYVGPFYTDNFKNENNKNDAYTVVDIECLYQLPEFAGMGLTLRGEVRNVLNRFYTSSGEGNAFFPAAERNYLIGLTSGF